MRIISPYQDYYDRTLAHGQDENVLYLRRAEATLASEDNPFQRWVPWRESALGNPLKWWNAKTKVNEHFSRLFSTAPDGPSATLGLLVVGSKAYPWWVCARPYDYDRSSLGHFMSAALMSDPHGKGLTGSQDLRRIGDRIQQAFSKMVRDPNEELLPLQRHGAGPTSIQGDHELVWSAPPKGYTKQEKLEYGKRRDAWAAALKQDWTDFSLANECPVSLILPVQFLTYVRHHGEASVESQLKGLGVGIHRDRYGWSNDSLIIKNPKLAGLDAGHSLNPQELFQSIAQFISGVAPGQSMPMVKLQDRDLIAKKGFDPKYGFRTRPEGK